MNRVILLAPLAMGLLISGCSRPQASPPAFTTPPTISRNPNPSVPLAAVVRFVADRLISTTLEISDGKHEWTHQFEPSRSPGEGLPVIGMRPGRTHQVRITIRDQAGARTVAPQALEYTTPPLPDDPAEFPKINITIRKQDQMEPGITITNPRRRMPGQGPEVRRFNQGYGMLIALDSEGEIVWYYRSDSRISDFQLLRNGNIAYVTQDYRAVEVDWLGNKLATWWATGRPEGETEGMPIPTMTIHHEIDELPSGNLVVLGTERREIENYYTSDTDPDAPRKPQKVMGDLIVEFQRDGRVAWTWNTWDHLDPFRLGYQTFNGYWVRRGFPETVDWTHGNSLLYDEHDNALLVSLRYQAAILKIDRATGQICWILGEPGGWPAHLEDRVLKLEGDARWFYHQHSPEPTPHGTVLLFDNGNFRARPFKPPLPPAQTWSRAVEYAIDEDNMTVREVWTSDIPGEERVVSVAMGDADWLPQTGNVLVTYGLLIPQHIIEQYSWGSITNIPGWTRLREFRRTTPPVVVWEAIFDSKNLRWGWTVFGSAHVPRLQP